MCIDAYTYINQRNEDLTDIEKLKKMVVAVADCLKKPSLGSSSKGVVSVAPSRKFQDVTFIAFTFCITYFLSLY